MLFYDSETVGFEGPIVLLQYAYDDGPIILYEPWREPIYKTIALIEEFMNHEGGVCGFNLAFDHFHLCQMYTTLLLTEDHNKLLGDCIEEYAIKESEARLGPCLKPQQCLDLMLHARKGPYQSTMDRDEIRIKRVPTAIAWELAQELGKRIKLKDVYFAKKSNPKDRWGVYDIHDEDGKYNPDFKDLVLKFAPSSALKALAQDALDIDTEKVKVFSDVELPKAAMPVEYGYAPFATAIGGPGNWNGAWPDYGKIKVHINHWAFNRNAREYAKDDVKYTRMLYHHFEQPEAGDVDSELACMVGAVRWHGFKIDVDRIKQLRDQAAKTISEVQFNFQSVEVCRRFLEQAMDDTEKMVLSQNGKLTTKSIILEEVAKWEEEDVCDSCYGEGCEKCSDGLIKTGNTHPAALRASKILAARRSKKQIELFDKLLLAGRFHASFNVIGTLSSRMSGGDSESMGNSKNINPQGINRDTEIRSAFPLADDGFALCGGDFDGFEVVLMDASYADPKLREELLNGYKIHGIAGTFFFPDLSYDDILETKGLPNEKDKYDRSKKGVFALFYGGEGYTLSTRVGIDQEIGDRALEDWKRKYKKWASERQKIFDKFCSMRQPGGLGTKVEWHEPSDYIESMFGFRRYFTLENSICRVLFNLAQEPPKHWTNIDQKVVRRDREQTVSGAARSALFAAAFSIQAANMRAAANHVIQSSGAELTKGLQNRIWGFQPKGINAWEVLPLNVHDEIMAPTKPDLQELIHGAVDKFVEEFKKDVPLLKIDWSSSLTSWADK